MSVSFIYLFDSSLLKLSEVLYEMSPVRSPLMYGNINRYLSKNEAISATKYHFEILILDVI